MDFSLLFLLANRFGKNCHCLNSCYCHGAIFHNLFYYELLKNFQYYLRSLAFFDYLEVNLDFHHLNFL